MAASCMERVKSQLTVQIITLPLQTLLLPYVKVKTHLAFNQNPYHFLSASAVLCLNGFLVFKPPEVKRKLQKYIQNAFGFISGPL